MGGCPPVDAHQSYMVATYIWWAWNREHTHAHWDRHRLTVDILSTDSLGSATDRWVIGIQRVHRFLSFLGMSRVNFNTLMLRQNGCHFADRIFVDGRRGMYSMMPCWLSTKKAGFCLLDHFRCDFQQLWQLKTDFSHSKQYKARIKWIVIISGLQQYLGNYMCRIDCQMIRLQNIPSCWTHWGRDKMAAIFQTGFSNAFSWMKMDKFRSRFHWSLF